MATETRYRPRPCVALSDEPGLFTTSTKRKRVCRNGADDTHSLALRACRRDFARCFGQDGHKSILSNTLQHRCRRL